MNRLAVKRFIGYFIYISFFIFILYKGTLMEKYLKRLIVLDYNPHPYNIFIMVFPVVIGLLLALPGFASKFKAGGKWRYDWVKFFSVGMPTFFVTFSAGLLFYTPIGIYLPIFGFLLTHSPTPQTICGVVFGYLFLSVFYKQEEL